jgi:nucleoside 2-deoxyribosyltransferase
VTAADAVIACGVNPGTASEIALAVRAGKAVALVRPDAATAAFFGSMSANATVHVASTADDAVAWLVQRQRGDGR